MLCTTPHHTTPHSRLTVCKRSGFTLIELSIVLVIIGLLVGGVLVGQDLIAASKIRQKASQLQEMKTAVNVFRLKYNCIAGDCPNAATTFGLGGGDGDGDKKIEWSAERIDFWTHMENAGILQFETTSVSTTRRVSTLGSQVHMYVTVEALYATNVSYAYDDKNMVGITGGPSTVGSWQNGALTTAQAYGVDTKIDDGMPGSGNFVSIDGIDDLAATTNCDVSATEYDLTITNPESCWAAFDLGI